MATFSYFLHPPRDDFAETMTEHEQQTWGQHFTWLQELYAAGQLVLVGVTLGRVNTGVSILEAAPTRPPPVRSSPETRSPRPVWPKATCGPSAWA
jgi:hypothetical protein